MKFDFPPTSNLSGFLATREGVGLSFDLVLKPDSEIETRATGRVSIPRANLSGTYAIGNMPVQVLELTPDFARIQIADREVRLTRQTKGRHYWGLINPSKALPVSDEEWFGSEQITENGEIPF